MKYSLLIYVDPVRFGRLSREEQNRVHAACGQWHADILKHGHGVAAIGLQPVATAKTVRSDGQRITVTDGPFAETREFLGGLECIDCSSYDIALAYARSFPGLAAGCSIELRPEVPGGVCEA